MLTTNLEAYRAFDDYAAKRRMERLIPPGAILMRSTEPHSLDTRWTVKFQDGDVATFNTLDALEQYLGVLQRMGHAT